MANIKCPACGKTNPPDSEVCKFCASPLQAAQAAGPSRGLNLDETPVLPKWLELALIRRRKAGHEDTVQRPPSPRSRRDAADRSPAETEPRANGGSGQRVAPPSVASDNENAGQRDDGSWSVRSLREQDLTPGGLDRGASRGAGQNVTLPADWLERLPPIGDTKPEEEASASFRQHIVAGPPEQPPAWLQNFRGRAVSPENLPPPERINGRGNGRSAEDAETELPEWLANAGRRAEKPREPAPPPADPVNPGPVPSKPKATKPPPPLQERNQDSSARELPAARSRPKPVLGNDRTRAKETPAPPPAPAPKGASPSQRGAVRPLRPSDVDNLFIDLPDWLSSDGSQRSSDREDGPDAETAD